MTVIAAYVCPGSRPTSTAFIGADSQASSSDGSMDDVGGAKLFEHSGLHWAIAGSLKFKQMLLRSLQDVHIKHGFHPQLLVEDLERRLWEPCREEGGAPTWLAAALATDGYGVLELGIDLSWEVHPAGRFVAHGAGRQEARAAHEALRMSGGFMCIEKGEDSVRVPMEAACRTRIDCGGELRVVRVTRGSSDPRVLPYSKG